MFGKKKKLEQVDRIRVQDAMKDDIAVEDEEEMQDDEQELEDLKDDDDPEIKALTKKIEDLKVKKKATESFSRPPSKEEIKDMILGNLNRAADLMRYL